MAKLFKYKCPNCQSEHFRIVKYVTIHADYGQQKITHRHVKSEYYCKECGRQAFPSEILSVAGMEHEQD